MTRSRAGLLAAHRSGRSPRSGACRSAIPHHLAEPADKGLVDGAGAAHLLLQGIGVSHPSAGQRLHHPNLPLPFLHFLPAAVQSPLCWIHRARPPAPARDCSPSFRVPDHRPLARLGRFALGAWRQFVHPPGSSRAGQPRRIIKVTNWDTCAAGKSARARRTGRCCDATQGAAVTTPPVLSSKGGHTGLDSAAAAPRAGRAASARHS